jgi:hypothetical protein
MKRIYIFVFLLMTFGFQSAQAAFLVNDVKSMERIILDTDVKCPIKQLSGTKYHGTISSRNNQQEVCWDYSPDHRRIRTIRVVNEIRVGHSTSNQSVYISNIQNDYPVTYFKRVSTPY